MQIVGVVPDIRTTASEQAEPVYYRSLNQSPLPTFVLYVRVGARSAHYTSAIVNAIVKELPESAGRLQVYTAQDQRRQRDLPAVAMFWLSTGLATIALLVTGLGLYGVASYAAVARRKEHGIRAALGASPRQLAAIVMGEGLRWTALASVLSLPFVWVGMRVASAFVVGAHQIPTLTAFSVIGIYGVVVLLALVLPARQSSHCEST